MTPKTEYQPRYVAYCKANGNTPEAHLEADRLRYSGVRMCGFICWMSDRKRAFAAAHPEKMLNGLVADHDAFTAFLNS